MALCSCNAKSAVLGLLNGDASVVLYNTVRTEPVEVQFGQPVLRQAQD